MKTDNIMNSHFHNFFNLRFFIVRFSVELIKKINQLQPHEHVGSFSPFKAARIIAVAHPTPLLTKIAPVGQFNWQAPHSMHRCGAAKLTKLLFRSKTAWGQTVVHILQLLHNSVLNLSVFTEYALYMITPPIRNRNLK